ncbi:C40 family peptidase [Peribacillus muralis]|uniref:C40 family peptidase n=1 Tax=Peribacillus muralis TaxID=264697 RepID=UPI001F4D945B|nr:C40 family peptidase [Peribacillus muralis]MCK1993920.1 C40 family peptidase [Peribacillus muralis]MCK2014475.1 C40 family peptidase [Peribacillus muralis]
MSYRLPVTKWLVAIALLLALLSAFVLSPANASASINYGDEVAAMAKKQVGSSYKYGGTTPKGFDASGLTQYVYKNAVTELKIPRTSSDQYKTGKVIKQKDLKAGDLVFFATGKKGQVSFVGIYYGNGTFVGATSKGVKEVKMSDTYWKEKYIGAKRVIKQ